MPLSLPFLSLGPIVEVEPQQIRARTSNIMLGLTLGAWRDFVVVDSRRRTVEIRRTKLWGFTSNRTIRFDEIGEVAYSMIDGSVGSVLSGEREGPETFDVALTLHTGEEVPLLRFSGDGEYAADVSVPHEWISDRITEATDVRGNQQERSLNFVDLLSFRLGVPIGSSRYF
ncbi:hypothetical protein EON82_04535 [bacterium]|nr:MAG: hypothetical protein EON82_04535 [bacterium]